jgi:hypothetical protein
VRETYFHDAALDGLVTLKAMVPSKTMEVRKKSTVKGIMAKSNKVEILHYKMR